MSYPKLDSVPSRSQDGDVKLEADVREWIESEAGRCALVEALQEANLATSFLDQAIEVTHEMFNEPFNT